MFQQEQQPRSSKLPLLLQADRTLGATSKAASEVLSGDGCSPSSTSTTSVKRPHHHARRWSDIPFRSALCNAVVFETTLKDKSKARRNGLFGSLHTSSNSSRIHHHRRANSMVHFNTVVSCVEIPSRTQYSKRIKQSLWRDREELDAMVERNKKEFRFENYDWHSVVLDDDMYVDSINGELVHPCHVRGYDFEDNDDDSSASEQEKKQEDEEKDSGFVRLGEKGKSTWEAGLISL
jgi:hypothetical protein